MVMIIISHSHLSVFGILPPNVRYSEKQNIKIATTTHMGLENSTSIGVENIYRR